MEASDGSPPTSLCMVRAAELFPKPQMELEDSQLKVPFQELAGESVKYLGRTDDGVLALSNYRIFLQKTSTNVETSIPLGLIESAQSRDLFHLIIYCKDASTVKCSFEIAEQCTEWQRRIQMCTGVPETLESIFAFPFCSWACDSLNSAATNGNQTYNSQPDNGQNPSTYSALDYAERLQKSMSRYEDDFMREVERLGFDLNGSWRISHANEEFKLCPSYPPKLLVPCCISDETLSIVANFRGSRRLPAVVWRHRKSGAVIARCSQPEVGWLGWRNTKDEQLLKALADACAFDRGERNRQLANSSQSAQSIPISSGDSSPSSPDASHEEVPMDEVRKILIVDARSYTSAVTNRARGGGCECIEYYPCAEIEFMNLGNIHVIRKSFHALRQLCGSPPDVPNWLGLLEKTMWFQHLSGLLAASMTVCHAVEKQGRPVLVHCSDGWDRTPQIVATAQLCLDPYYRTVEGFRVLVEREWLSFGHKFADRCGHGPGSEELNERCPVFLQWLDLVHQIHEQFSCSFEFSMGYLIKLAQHSHSGLFGNFLCNTLKERLENSVFERTFSVWSFLNGPMYRNPLYKPHRDKVLWPAHNVRDMKLWTEVYLGSLGGNQNCIDFPAYINENLAGSINSMSKTRSYGDLITAGFIQNSMSRRSSDPNMTVDPNLTIGSNSENNSIADLQSDDHEESSEILANLIHDTTRKLEGLTNDLNNHDSDDDYKLLSKPSGILSTNDDDDDGSKLITTIQTNGGTADNVKDDDIEQNRDCQQKTTTITTKDLHLTLKGINGMEAIKTNYLGENMKNVEVMDSVTNGYHGIEHSCNGITIEKNSALAMDLMKSFVMDDSPCNPASNGVSSILSDPKTDDTQNLWHGNLNTSTDTLVPVQETKSQNGSYSCDNLDGKEGRESQESIITNSSSADKLKISTNSNILPKVHSSNTNNVNATPRPNQLSTNTNNNSITTLTMAAKLCRSENDIEAAPNNSDSNVAASCLQPVTTDKSSSSSIVIPNCGMDESILILPEHRKLEISYNETIAANATATSSPTAPPEMVSLNQLQQQHLTAVNVTAPSSLSSMSANALPFSVNAVTATTTTTNTPIQSQYTTTAASSQRRRRTSSSNSKRDAFVAKNINGSYVSRFSLPGGVRSLPMTPPGLTDRPQVTISCPDGLAHALSEENIRLQQIVHEHKLREDVLLREIHDMRMALLKKICPNCNNANASTTNDEQCSALDNVENASICSWEAVEDRSTSGPSSCTTTSSSIQPNTTSVLWVPDHAVSCCTSCQTEFWLGRRKHHCRSCGQIFCADCSEFWAPLPDAKLFSPVRLCGPCYHSVTTRMQQVNNQLQQSTLLHLQQSVNNSINSNSSTNSSNNATATKPAATSKA